IRTREDADFTPEQVQNKRSTAESTTAETESGGVATGTSTSQDPARPIKPVRQAALQASARLTKEAQAKALGLGAGGRASGLLGASLGIAGRKTSADASPSVDTSSADREADAMDQDTDETANGADVGILPKDQDLAMIEATQQRQQKKAADMAELCRVIDKACISGAVMETGAELLRAALAIALRHGELGPSGPPVAAALIDNVRSYPVDKPHQYQRKTASAEKRPETSTLTARQTTGGAAVPPRQMAPGRRWENLSGMRTLGGEAGSAQAAAAKGGMKASVVMVTLTAGSPSHQMAAHQRKEAVNMALEAKEVPQHVRMLSSELNGSTLKIKPALNCSLGELFQYRDVIRSALDAEEVHDSKQWVRYKVMFVPLEAAGLALSTTIIKAGIEESIGAKLVRDPHRLRHGTGAENELWNHVQFAVLEEDKVRRPRAVAIAGVEYQVTEFVDKRSKSPCSRCLGFHKPFATGCHNPARCEHCGSEAHKTEDHTCKHCAGHGARTCPPVCANCNGPHRSDDQSCKLAPRMNKHARCWLVPSHGQAKAVRNQGRIDHQKAIQALATERKEIAASSAAAAGDKGDDDAGVGSSMDMEVTPPGSA
ncbi:hypothetical protein A4X06_0g9284, partial [Tilletia controversa]